jgi:hypothetical protein
MRTGLRGKGGPIADLDAATWKTDQGYFKFWFARCEMSAADPYCQQVTGPNFKQIFVLKTDVDRAIGAWTGETLLTVQAPEPATDETAPLTPSQRRELLAKVATALRVRLNQSPKEKTHTIDELADELLPVFEKVGLNKRMITHEIWPRVRDDYPAWTKRGPKTAKRA